MLFSKLEDIKFSELTDGQATMNLLAIGEEMNVILATRRGNQGAANICRKRAIKFRGLIKTLHTDTINSLAYTGGTDTENKLVNAIIAKAKLANQPAITMTHEQEQTEVLRLANAFNGSGTNEFDPTRAQILQCQSDAATRALEEELKNGRTFNQGTFDPDTESVYPVGNDGRLVVILKANLEARKARIFEACTARMVMENIVNKKLGDNGNEAIYSIMHQQGHQITWNPRVQQRLFFQEQFIALSAAGTGLSEQNIRLVLQNSAVNINEQSPSETIVATGAQLFAPGSKVPTTLPPLSDVKKTGGGVPDLDEVITGGIGVLVTTALASGNLAFIIGSIAALAIYEFIDPLSKLREDIFKSLPDPTVIAARCEDANIPLEDCEGLPDDFINNNGGGNSTNNSNSGVFALLALVGGIFLAA